MTNPIVIFNINKPSRHPQQVHLTLKEESNYLQPHPPPNTLLKTQYPRPKPSPTHSHLPYGVLFAAAAAFVCVGCGPVPPPQPLI